MGIFENSKKGTVVAKLAYVLQFVGAVMMVSNMFKGQSIGLGIVAFMLILAPYVLTGSKRDRIAFIAVMVGAAILAMFTMFEQDVMLALVGITIMMAGLSRLYHSASANAKRVRAKSFKEG